MTTPYIIELSRKDADSYNTAVSTYSNSDWTNSIKTSLTVEEGDTISLRNAFINTGDDLVFSTDTVVHMTVGFYDINYLPFADTKRDKSVAPATMTAHLIMTSTLVGRWGLLLGLLTLGWPGRDLLAMFSLTAKRYNCGSNTLIRLEIPNSLPPKSLSLTRMIRLRVLR